MTTDLESIAQIEKKIGEKLERYEGRSFFSDDSNKTYLLDEHKNVVGLILCKCVLYDISFLKLLSNLTQLNLSGNYITNISVLDNLKNLTQLNLSENKISDISVLKSLPNLKNLDLNKNNISDISILRSLPNLAQLDLRRNNITDYLILQSLPNITLLGLSYNSTFNIAMLRRFPNLTQLDLSRCQISDISILRGLPNITQLDLSHNYITDISVLVNLRNLTQLDLSFNKITDISALKYLPKLTQLDLSFNKITDISVIEYLKNAIKIELSNNKISDLPKKIITLNLEIVWKDDKDNFDRGINLNGNPIQIPPEIVKKGRTATEAYFKSLEESEKKALGEVKVLLVGDGGSGKTSLVRRLFGEGFDKHQAKTDGIQIRDGYIEEKTQKIRLRFWDFGGQEVMHATHQFFLSKRSLYILVLDGRKEEDAEYWLKHIESFGGDSSILIALNKIDQNPGFDVNRRFLQDKYKGIRGFYRISCATGTGINEFFKILQNELQEVELIRTIWAKSWFNVKSCLENLNKHFISFQEYRDICGKESIGDTLAQNTLVGFLNDLGVVVHFSDLNLSAMYVLEPRWVTEAVYKIINSKDLAENKGVLNLCLLDKILCQKADADYCYPSETYRYIIDLMEKFELCYTVDKDKVLIPDLLEIQESKFDFDYPNALKFRLEYDFLPKSVMPRFIVKRHKDIRKNLQWRTGVVLEDNAFHTIAVVKADVRDRKIEIWVMGDQKRDYFSVIRKTFKNIHDGFEKLDVKELIPLPDHPEIAVEYRRLIGHERANKDEYFDGILGKSYSVSKLLNGIEKKEDRQRRAERIIHVHGDYKESSRTVSVGGNVEDANLIVGDGSAMLQHKPVDSNQ